MHPLFELLRKDSWILENKALRWSLGNDEAAIYAELLSIYNYFAVREQLTKDGYFFNTVDDLYLKTHIATRAQRSAIKKLVKVGLIDMQLRGIPPVRFFKIYEDENLLKTYLEKGHELIKNARKALNDAKKDKRAFINSAECPPNKNNNIRWLNLVDPVDELYVEKTEVFQ